MAEGWLLSTPISVDFYHVILMEIRAQYKAWLTRGSIRTGLGTQSLLSSKPFTVASNTEPSHMVKSILTQGTTKPSSDLFRLF